VCRAGAATRKSTARETPAMMRDNPFHHGNAIPAATEPAEM
jgi:hypothetical protein